MDVKPTDFPGEYPLGKQPIVWPLKAYFTAEERDRINVIAAAMGMTVKEFIRAAVMVAVEKR